MRRMRLLMSIGIGCLLTIALVRANSSKAPPTPPQGSHFGFDWSISQEPGAEKVFRCLVRVRDLDTGAIVANPALLSKWGERAEITQAGDGRSLTVSVLVDDQGRRATIEARLVSDGHPIAEHQASVGL